MSDFDKEAERERLREKYERDQEKREATEQMSELLLKGATMTNAHCEQCGDPIFRYEGQSFCPTCEEVVGERERAGDDGSPDENGTADAVAAETDAAPADQSEDTTGSPPRQEPPATPTGQSSAAATPEPTPSRRNTAEREPAPAESGDGDLATARESLVRSLVAQTRQAETCEDPRRARDHLAAAREAAEALSALSY